MSSFVVRNCVPRAQVLDMVGFNASNRRVVDAPPHFGMKFWLNRLVILLDRELWGRVYELFNLAKDNEELKVSSPVIRAYVISVV